MRNTARWSGDGLSIDLELIMALGTKDPRDVIEIGGPVPLFPSIYYWLVMWGVQETTKSSGGSIFGFG